MNVGRSKSGLPTLTENGGGATNTGYATLVCGPNGERVKPLWIPRGYSNGDHAGFVVQAGMCIINAEHVRSQEYVCIYRITRIGDGNDPDKLVSYVVGEWENNDGNLPDCFDVVVQAAISKAHCYHCREAHYIKV